MRTSFRSAPIVFSLLAAFAGSGIAPLRAQENTPKTETSGPKKRVVIITTEIDENGNEKVTKIIREGKDAEGFMSKDIKAFNPEKNGKDGMIRVETDIKEINGDKDIRIIRRSQSGDDSYEYSIPDQGGNKAFLGVTIDDEEEGAVIRSVTKNSAAEKAGLKENDMLLSLNGQEIKTFDGLRKILSGLKPGDEVSIAYQRNGQKQQAKAQLGKKEESSPVQYFRSYRTPEECLGKKAFLGVNISDAKGEKGAAVTGVIANTAASGSGLREGDVIYKIDDTSIGSADDLVNAIGRYQPGDKVKVRFLRGNDKDWEGIRLGSKTYNKCVTSLVVEDNKKTRTVPGEPLERNDAGEVKLQLQDVKIFPNPSNGATTVRFTAPDNAPISVSVTDTNGRTVFLYESDRFNGSFDRNIDLASEPEGVYLLKVVQRNKVYTDKIVVSKK